MESVEHVGIYGVRIFFSSLFLAPTLFLFSLLYFTFVCAFFSLFFFIYSPLGKKNFETESDRLNYRMNHFTSVRSGLV